MSFYRDHIELGLYELASNTEEVINKLKKAER